MATPYLVPKISMAQDPNDFDHCDSVNTNGTSFNYSQSRRSVGPGLCRFSCATWCTLCENQVQSDFSERKLQPDMLNGSVYQTGGLRIQQVSDYKFLSNESQDTFGLNHNRTKEYASVSNVSEVNEKGSDSFYPSSSRSSYSRELDALRGRLRAMKEQFPNQISECALKAVSAVNSKLNVVSNLSSPHEQSSLNAKLDYKDLKERKRISTALDTKRVRQYSESEANVFSNVAAGPKRARDASPKLHEDVPSSINGMTSLYQLREDPKEDLSSPDSIPLESDDSLESDEEEDTCSYEDDNGFSNAKFVRFHSASVSPSHSVGDNFRKISLNDKPQKVIVEYNPNLHPLIRLSLFPYVPPYVRFSNHDVREKPFPLSIQKYLKWKLTNITPIVVRKTVVNSGFKLVRKSIDWTGTWGKHMKSVCFKTLKENQKLNHFPGTFQLGRKDRLWRNLYHHMSKYGKKEFGFIPRTFVLPQDNKALRASWDRSGSKAKWIIKPPAAARGAGIKVINKWSQLPKKAPLIVQKYISNPYLINGSKFDLRLYVLVTSFNPLCIYLYDNGLVRFASVKYSDDPNTLGDRYMHLTNYSINKFSSQYTQNENAEACTGHKWTIKTLWSYLKASVDIEALKENLCDLVIKTMISGESSINQLTWDNLPSRYCGYELFGVDVLLDENLKPWLLEVNISPSLHSSSSLDLAVKGPLVQDLMNIAGYHLPDKLDENQREEVGKTLGFDGNGLCYDDRLYTMGLSPEEKIKQGYFCDIEDREEYLTSILNNLTPDDVRHLIHYEDELTQLGNFKKIFPTTSTHSFQRFFGYRRYYNMLFDAWETAYHDNRYAGIKRLQSLCHQRIHLDISNVETRRSLICINEKAVTEDLDNNETILSETTRDNSTDNNDDSSHIKQDALLNGIIKEVSVGE